MAPARALRREGPRSARSPARWAGATSTSSPSSNSRSGWPPTLAARLLRLSTVWRHLDDEQSWARIAAECGYADQAHLTREFRRFTGTTPAALITA